MDNKDCLSCVIENSDFYADVINNSGVDGDALKNKIRNKLSSGKSEELEGFAAKIGINVSE